VDASGDAHAPQLVADETHGELVAIALPHCAVTDSAKAANGLADGPLATAR
jgi:hypothetical protein